MKRVIRKIIGKINVPLVIFLLLAGGILMVANMKNEPINKAKESVNKTVNNISKNLNDAAQDKNDSVE